MKNYLVDNKNAMTMKNALVGAGLEVNHNKVAIFRAIRKGYGQPWIVSHVANLFAQKLA